MSCSPVGRSVRRNTLLFSSTVYSETLKFNSFGSAIAISLQSYSIGVKLTVLAVSSIGRFNAYANPKGVLFVHIINIMEVGPNGRTSAILVNTDEGEFVLIGGSDRDLTKDDCYILEVEGKEVKWTRMELNLARFGSVGCYCGKIYVHGGQNVSNQFYMDFYEIEGYEINNLVVQPVNPNKWPSERANHAGVKVNDELHLFAGSNASGVLNDYFVFNFSTKLFKKLELDVKGREMHGLAVYNGKSFILGGKGEDDIFDQVEIFEDCKLVNSVKMPSKLCCFGYVQKEKYVIVAGGTDGIEFFDSIWVFDLELCQWFVSCFNLTSCRIGTAVAADNDVVVIFGGSEYSKESNDLQIVPLGELFHETSLKLIK